MKAKSFAALSLIAWIIAVALMTSQVGMLEERLSYDETIFLRKELESYVGLSKLNEAGLQMKTGETIVVIYKPVDLSRARLVESVLQESLREFGGTIIGPYSLYSQVVNTALYQLSTKIAESLSSYELLVKTGRSANETATYLQIGLERTYGLAETFMTFYLFAVQQGHPDPGLYAYEQLSRAVSSEMKPLLDFFYTAFSSYERELALEEAAKKAAIDLGRSLDPTLAQAMEFFDLNNYRDKDRVLLYVYNAFGLESLLRFEVFKALVKSPQPVALALIKEELSRADPCLTEAFERSLKGEGPELAIGVCKTFVETKLVPFPQGIPEDLRLTFFSLDGKYSLAIGYTSVALKTEQALNVEKYIRERLEGALEELHLYGTINVKTERLKVLEEDSGRVDKIVAASLLVITTTLLGTFSASILIFVVTIIALITALGIISIAALYTDIYYLGRLFIVPLVFSISADYSIYYLFRVLEEKEKGKSWNDAVVEAWRKVSIALAIGGLTGIAGFAAFLLSDHGLLRSVGIALLISVAIAFLASLTLTPAILFFAGERLVAWPRRELKIPARGLGPKLRRASELVLRFRTHIILASLIVLAIGLYFVATTPVTQNVYLSFPRDSNFVKMSEILFTHFDVSRFSTLLVVAEGQKEELETVIRDLESRGVIVRHRTLAEEPYVVVELGIAEDPLGDGARKVVYEVRRALSEHNIKAYVTGLSPLLSDTIDDLMKAFYMRTLPIALLFVALVIGVLTGSLFQSVRILVTAVLALLVSIVATTSFFNFYLELPHFTKSDSLFYWVVPIILWGFTISTGVDFEAFLTARIKEEYERLRDVNSSVLEAVEKTGVVISVLAVIYIAAFGSLTTSSIPLLKMIGFAIAVFFFVDAFITRVAVVPAYVSALDKLNWWPRER
ncbi:MAG: MMPL family transporter [Acidilobaceae archaeon]